MAESKGVAREVAGSPCGGFAVPTGGLRDRHKRKKENDMDTASVLEELRTRLQALEDESAIRRMMAEMMTKADERTNPKWGEQLASFYTDDGIITSASGSSRIEMRERGHTALIKRFSSPTRFCESTHLLGSESIEVSGDEAKGTWVSFEPATLRCPDNTEEAVWTMGRYIGEFRRTSNGWRIRTFHYEGVFCTPYDKGWTNERFVPVRVVAVEKN